MNPMQMMQMFPQFMAQYRGQDPNQLVQQILSSGQLNQDQINQAQQMRQQMAGQFDGFKSMFGFK